MLLMTYDKGGDDDAADTTGAARYFLLGRLSAVQGRHQMNTYVVSLRGGV